MEIEADHQGDIRTNVLSHPFNQFPLTVFEMLGDHGAVQIQVDGIKGMSGCEPGQQQGGKVLKCLTRDVG